jgi:hypothetical protein
MSTENKLENLEFFESFMDTDPLDNLDDLTPDPNKNIAPDILSGENFDPLADDDSDDSNSDDDLPLPKGDTKTPPVNDDNDDNDDLDDNDDSDDDSSDDDSDEDSDNTFEVFAKGLAQAGILDLEDEDLKVENWDEKSFIDVMEKTVDNRMWAKMEELAMETYGEAGVKLIEDIFINKVPVPEYLQMFSNEQVVENVDLSDENNQERIFRLYLAKTGMDEDEIEDQLNYARDNERLEAYAQKYQTKLVEKMQEERERLSQEAEARLKDIQKREDERQESYAKVLEESVKAGDIVGYPINNKDAEELFSFVLDRPHVLPNGQRISDFEYRLATMRQEDPKKFLAVARLVQKDLDLSPVKKKAVSEETNSIFKGLKTKTKTSSRSNKQEDLFAKYFK